MVGHRTLVGRLPMLGWQELTSPPRAPRLLREPPLTHAWGVPPVSGAIDARGLSGDQGTYVLATASHSLRPSPCTGIGKGTDVQEKTRDVATTVDT